MPRPIVTLYESVSANGLIARPDDDVSFLSDAIWTDWVERSRKGGAMVWGRRTHEMYRAVAARELDGVLGIVLTRDASFALEPGWRRAATPEDAVRLAEEAGARELVVSGGSQVNAAFAGAGLLDRLVLDVEAVVVAAGVPLFPPLPRDLRLALTDIVRLSGSVAQLRFDVAATSSPAG